MRTDGDGVWGPVKHPEHTNTPDERTDDQTPNETPTRTADLARRLRQRAAVPMALLREGLGTRQTTRVAPKARLAQLGAAAVAAGVLGVALGNAGQPQQSAAPPQSEQKVAPVAEATPLAAAKPAAPALAPDQPQPKDQLDTWISQARATMISSGVPADKINPDEIRQLIEHESGGNPTITNNWDSNAKKGTPSKGLMQTIDPTFQANALPGHNDIYNPVDNIIAGSKYSIQSYGSISGTPGLESTKSGGSYQGY